MNFILTAISACIKTKFLPSFFFASLLPLILSSTRDFIACCPALAQK